MNGDTADAALHFFAGFALFLYGLEKSFFALEALNGDGAKRFLGRLTDRLLPGAGLGLMAALLLLSGAVTVRLLSGLASMELLAFPQAVHALAGATVGAALPVGFLTLALDLPELAWIPMVAGMILLYVTTDPKIKLAGHLLFGIGLLCFALEFMGEALHPLASHPAWPAIRAQLFSPLSGLLVATLMTLLLRSSNAVMGVVLVLAFEGLISFSEGLIPILGVTLGAGCTPLLEARGKSRVALRVAIAHGILKAAGVLLVTVALILFPDWLPQPEGGGERAWLLALAQLLLGVSSVLIFLPASGVVVRFCQRVAPELYSGEAETPDFNSGYWPKYLDDTLIATPTLALAMARRETGLIGELLEEMIGLVPEAIFAGDATTITKLRRMDDRVDEIHQAITRYLARIGASGLAPRMADQLLANLTVVNELEAIGDIIENNLVHLAEVCARERIVFAPEPRQGLVAFHQAVHRALRDAASAFLANNAPRAAQVMAMKDEINTMDAALHLQQLQALQTGPEQEPLIASHTVQTDIRENFKRIYYHAKRIAKVVASVSGSGGAA